MCECEFSNCIYQHDPDTSEPRGRYVSGELINSSVYVFLIFR